MAVLLAPSSFSVLCSPAFPFLRCLLQFAPVPILGLDGSWGLIVERIEFFAFVFSVCLCLPLCFQYWVGEGLLEAAVLVVVCALVAGGGRWRVRFPRAYASALSGSQWWWSGGGGCARRFVVVVMW
jgi:hypothetical protein